MAVKEEEEEKRISRVIQLSCRSMSSLSIIQVLPSMGTRTVSRPATHTDIQKETLGERFFLLLLLLSPSEERKEEVIYDFISSRIRIVPDASSTSPFHPSRFLLCTTTSCILVCTERRGELVMRFLSAAPADFLGRFLFCVWSAKEYPWWMLSPSSFLIFLLPFSIERERQYIYSTHKYLWKRSAEICVTARKKRSHSLSHQMTTTTTTTNIACALSVYIIYSGNLNR